jgi:hypothetical protein
MPRIADDAEVGRDPLAGKCRRSQSSALVLAIERCFLLTIGDPEQSVMLTLCDPVLAIIGLCSQSSGRARILCN